MKRLIVAGCLVQRYKEDLRKAIPEIDGFIPLSSAGAVAQLLARPDLAVPVTGDVALYDGLSPRILSTPPFMAYVKIAEGCDNPCSFCPIPTFRGRLHSRPADDIVREVQKLAATGVQEVLLVAQDTTDYGTDLGMKDGLALLLRRLQAETEVPWIRLLYAYPNHLTRRRPGGHGALLQGGALPGPAPPARPRRPPAIHEAGRERDGVPPADSRRPAPPCRGWPSAPPSSWAIPGEKREHFSVLLRLL